MKRYTSLLLALLMFPMVALSQYTIRGTVTEENNNEPLAGGNILVLGTSIGSSVDAEGYYEIEDLENGTYSLRASMVGFETVEKEVTISGSDEEVNFVMAMSNLALQELEVFASRSTQKTPVAYST